MPNGNSCVRLVLENNLSSSVLCVMSTNGAVISVELLYDGQVMGKKVIQSLQLGELLNIKRQTL